VGNRKAPKPSSRSPDKGVEEANMSPSLKPAEDALADSKTPSPGSAEKTPKMNNPRAQWQQKAPSGATERKLQIRVCLSRALSGMD
jgi:hypothetical protein